MRQVQINHRRLQTAVAEVLLDQSGVWKRGQDSIVRSTLRAVPAIES